MPQWAGSTIATLAVKQAWSRYATALAQHEGGHAKIGLAGAADLRKRIKEIDERLTCNALKEQLDSLCEHMLEEFRTKDKEYDRTTAHGATQGARLPRSSAPP